MFQALAICSDKGLKLAMSALETLFGGKFTVSLSLSVCLLFCVCTFIQLLSFYLSLTLLFPSVHSPTPQFYPKVHLGVHLLVHVSVPPPVDLFVSLKLSYKTVLLLLATVCLGRQWKSAPKK